MKMNTQKYFCLVFLLIQIKNIQAQCNILQVKGIINYFNQNSCGLSFQGALSRTFVNASCAGNNYNSVLTAADISTPTFEEGPLQSIHIYPNPINNFINIDWHELQKDCAIDIRDLLGRSIIKHADTRVSGITTIDAASLHSGIYILCIYTKDYVNSISYKIVKP